MTALTNVPMVQDLIAYAGDTLSFTITAPASAVAGLVWKAQVRQSSKAETVDATFVIVPPSVADGPAQVTLLAVDTARLGDYYGVWDCQVSAPGGGDPVRTLARGNFTCEGDVSR